MMLLGAGGARRMNEAAAPRRNLPAPVAVQSAAFPV